ncbi:MAG: glycosyltransferase family 2 protein [Planctomycetes bacterium]|nr:glycosyltransferase family 2 protein [Planctomycetota bacterium]
MRGTARTAILITCCDRPEALERSLPQILALQGPALVVDDSADPRSRERHRRLVEATRAEYLPIPGTRRGLAAALNVGLSVLLADPEIEWVSYFQDDVDVDSVLLEVMAEVSHPEDAPLVTGHDAAEHEAVSTRSTPGGILYRTKRSCRATHLHAHRNYWLAVMPLPTRRLGAPCLEAERPGPGSWSDVDWWIATCSRRAESQAARAAPEGHVRVVPGLVRTFFHRAEDSLWGNNQPCGADPELSRKAIVRWLSARGGRPGDL